MTNETGKLLDQYRAEAVALKEEVERLTKDKARLDWLSTTDEPFVTIRRYYRMSGERYAGVMLCSKQCESAITADTLRAAIDAAREWSEG